MPTFLSVGHDTIMSALQKGARKSRWRAGGGDKFYETYVTAWATSTSSMCEYACMCRYTFAFRTFLSNYVITHSRAPLFASPARAMQSVSPIPAASVLWTARWDRGCSPAIASLFKNRIFSLMIIKWPSFAATSLDDYIVTFTLLLPFIDETRANY